MTTSSYESLSHSKWDGKYHVVFIPKGRKKALYGKIRKFLGPVWRELAGQRGSTIVEDEVAKLGKRLAFGEAKHFQGHLSDEAFGHGTDAIGKTGLGQVVVQGFGGDRDVP